MMYNIEIGFQLFLKMIYLFISYRISIRAPDAFYIRAHGTTCAHNMFLEQRAHRCFHCHDVPGVRTKENVPGARTKERVPGVRTSCVELVTLCRTYTYTNVRIYKYIYIYI